MNRPSTIINPGMVEQKMNQSAAKISNIEEALVDIRNGKIVIVVDNEDRENEGDFIMAAEKVTAETINFMARYGRGLICLPAMPERLKELELDLMVNANTALHGTPFTVSIDALNGATTGISAQDRAETIYQFVDRRTRTSARLFNC